MIAAVKTENGPDEAAAEIYQQHLDIVSNLLLNGEAEACMEHFGLPILIRTRTSEVIFETYEDLLEDTRAHGESLRGHGVTNYIRLVKHARRLSDTMIEGWHETYVLRGANSILPSYKSHMFLRRGSDGVWKVAEGEHELRDVRFPLHAVDSRPGSFSEAWSRPLSDIRVQYTRAEPLYQAFLQVLDQHQNAGDYDAWANQFSYPLNAHYDDGDHVFERPEDMRGFFDAMTDRLHGGTVRMERVIASADFLSSDRIVGYHTTRIFEDDKVTFGPVNSA